MLTECDVILQAKQEGFIDALVTGQFVDEPEASRRARRYYQVEHAPLFLPGCSILRDDDLDTRIGPVIPRRTLEGGAYTADPQIIHVQAPPLLPRFAVTAYDLWLEQFHSTDDFLHWVDQCKARDRVLDRKARGPLYRRTRWFLYRLGRYA